MTNDITCEVNLPEDKLSLIDDYVTFIVEKLKIKDVPSILIQDGKKDTITTTAGYSYGSDGCSIRVNGQNRAIVDILRSISHEMVHHAQNERGMIGKEKPPDIGGKIEDQANAYAGRFLKMYAKEKSALIYEGVEEKEPTPEEIEQNKKKIDKICKKIWEYWKTKGFINITDLTKYFSIHKLRTEEEREYFLEKFIEGMDSSISEFNIQYEKSTGFHLLGQYIGCSRCPGEILKGAKMIPNKTLPFEEYMFDYVDDASLKLLRLYTKNEHVNADFLLESYPDLCFHLAQVYSRAFSSAQNSELFKRVVKAVKETFQDAVLDFVHNMVEHKMYLNEYLVSEDFKRHLKSAVIEEFNDSVFVDGTSFFTTGEDLFKRAIDLYYHYNRIWDLLPEIGREFQVIDIEKTMRKGGFTSHIDLELFHEECQKIILEFFDV